MYQRNEEDYDTESLIRSRRSDGSVRPQQPRRPSSSRMSTAKKLALALFIVSMACVAFIVALAVELASHELVDVSYAQCEFIPTDKLNANTGVTGTIYFTRDSEGLSVSGTVRGLKKGRPQGQGYKIHEFASKFDDDLSDIAKGVGPVYNPGNDPHGCVTSNRRRAGDLGNLVPGEDGSVKITPTTNRMLQLAGAWSVLGRSIVIYEDEDHCKKGNDAPAPKAYATCNIVVRKPKNPESMRIMQPTSNVPRAPSGPAPALPNHAPPTPPHSTHSTPAPSPLLTPARKPQMALPPVPETQVPNHSSYETRPSVTSFNSPPPMPPRSSFTLAPTPPSQCAPPKPSPTASSVCPALLASASASDPSRVRGSETWTRPSLTITSSNSTDSTPQLEGALRARDALQQQCEALRSQLDAALAAQRDLRTQLDAALATEQNLRQQLTHARAQQADLSQQLRKAADAPSSPDQSPLASQLQNDLAAARKQLQELQGELLLERKMRLALEQRGGASYMSIRAPTKPTTRPTQTAGIAGTMDAVKPLDSARLPPPPPPPMRSLGGPSPQVSAPTSPAHSSFSAPVTASHAHAQATTPLSASAASDAMFGGARAGMANIATQDTVRYHPPPISVAPSPTHLRGPAPLSPLSAPASAYDDTVRVSTVRPTASLSTMHMHGSDASVQSTVPTQQFCDHDVTVRGGIGGVPQWSAAATFPEHNTTTQTHTTLAQTPPVSRVGSSIAPATAPVKSSAIPGFENDDWCFDDADEERMDQDMMGMIIQETLDAWTDLIPTKDIRDFMLLEIADVVECANNVAAARSQLAKLRTAFLNAQFALHYKIGSGGFGSVYKGIEKRTQRPVAIKIISLEDSEDDVSIITREINVLSQGHKCPQLIQYVGSTVINTSLWIVMEWVDGGSLLDIIKEKPLNEKHIAIVAREVLLGLLHLNNEQKVHRDIKAANILVSKNGALKLGDFGASRTMDTLTNKMDTFVGSPYWMAPEVMLQGSYGPSVDVWSLGITIIELATGKPPHTNVSPINVLQLIIREPPPLLVGNFSKELKEFVAMCLTKDPAQRATPSELLKSKLVKNAKKVSELSELFQ